MASDPTKDIQSLLKKLAKKTPGEALVRPAIDDEQPILACFTESFLLWEATSAKAAAAVPKLERAVVDYNELRVCLPDELVEVLGERYPRVEERVMRMRASLNDLFRREHAVSLEHLVNEPKRQARAYLESLEGVPAYVSARTALLALGAHAAPVDERLLGALKNEDVIDDGLDEEGAASLLERSIRAGELAEAHGHFQGWADSLADNSSSKRAPRKRSKTTTKKTSAKTTKKPGAR